MIVNHKLLDVDFRSTPNQGVPMAVLPSSIVLHFTAGRNLDSSVSWLQNPIAGASAHLIIGRDGEVVQLVPFNTVAWHAGKSSYKNRSGYNNFSIGIELENPGELKKNGNMFSSWFGGEYSESEVLQAQHSNKNRDQKTVSYWLTYTDKQIAKTEQIILELMDAYPIDEILGHEEIAPGRKTDPGPAFPLDNLRNRLLLDDRADNSANNSADTINTYTGLVTADLLNIRSGPGSHYQTLAAPIPKGQLVSVVNQEQNWYQVEVITKGWVYKQYVKN